MQGDGAGLGAGPVRVRVLSTGFNSGNAWPRDSILHNPRSEGNRNGRDLRSRIRGGAAVAPPRYFMHRDRHWYWHDSKNKIQKNEDLKHIA